MATGNRGLRCDADHRRHSKAANATLSLP